MNTPNPTFAATISGFVNGNGQSVVTGAPSLNTAATSSSPTGTYPITATIGTLSAANYTFSFVPGILTISQSPATLTISPASLSFSGTAGGNSPAMQSLSISASPNAAFTANVSGASWLSVLPANGTTPATLTVSASVTGLPAGAFSGSITVISNGNTKTVPITFAVATAGSTGSAFKLIGWNDLGMHCFDGKITVCSGYFRLTTPSTLT